MWTRDKVVNEGCEIATFAAGCFWGVEAAFRKVEGVKFTQVGYTGGSLENPTYKDVCSGKTGHAEAVEIAYDPKIVSYEDLLNIFWDIHDPTTLNRQGPDRGTQYRSSIFYHSDLQKETAFATKEKLQGADRYNGNIITEIVPATVFYQAEEYHQQYFEKQGHSGGCAIHF